MPRSLVRLAPLAAVIALTLSLAPVVASADPAPAPAQEEEHLKYPASAAAFRAHVNERIAAHRVRLEQRIADAQIGREKADAMRARFEAATAQVSAKVDEVCADGTVTGEEARAVHELAQALRERGKGDSLSPGQSR